MVWQHRYLTITVGLGFALALPTFAFDEKAPPNMLPAGAVNPPGVASVMVGLDMLQAASNKFSRANGLRLVKLMEEESARATERATKLADAKRQLLRLFSGGSPDSDDALKLHFMGRQVVAKLETISNPEEATFFVHSLNDNAKRGVYDMLLDDHKSDGNVDFDTPERFNILRGTHPLSARLAVALGYLPASLFEE